MLNAARAYRRLKEIEEKKLSNRILLLKVRPFPCCPCADSPLSLVFDLIALANLSLVYT